MGGAVIHDPIAPLTVMFSGNLYASVAVLALLAGVMLGVAVTLVWASVSRAVAHARSRASVPASRKRAM